MTWGTFSTCPIGLFSSTLKTCSTKTSQPLRAGSLPESSRLGEAVKELVAELARVQFSRRILKSGDFSYQKVHSLGESGYGVLKSLLAVFVQGGA